MTGTARIVLKAARIGFEDTKAEFTWRSYLFGWVTRAVAQVLFFTTMGLLVGGDDFIMFAFLGNVAAMTALSSLAAGPDTAFERALGTLPLLVAAPKSLLPVFAGRSLFHIVRGIAEASFVFALLATLLGWSGRWWLLPLGLLAVAIGAYGFGLFLAAVAVRRLQIGNMLFNFMLYVLIAIGGVNVPTNQFPAAVQRVAAALPLHHGLLGLRELLDGGISPTALAHLATEVAVGLAWLLAALVGFAWFAEGGRRDGTIHLAE